MEMYEVGGCVRDEILGVRSKDIDFSVVLTDEEIRLGTSVHGEPDPFAIMGRKLKKMGFEIFVETPEFLTIRARFPRYSNGSGFVMRQAHSGLTADFVLARKESDYTDGRRPDVVEAGSLMDDLARRDFTMNAIAKAHDGSLIDPFNGLGDIRERIIRAVGDPFDRFTEDALRAVRALRFSVTKSFSIDPKVSFAMESMAVLDAVRNKISDERIAAELQKMFRFDTVKSLRALQQHPSLTGAIFAGSVSLDATMKTKGRGGATGRPKADKPNLPVAHRGCACHCHTTPGVKHLAACCRP